MNYKKMINSGVKVSSGDWLRTRDDPMLTKMLQEYISAKEHYAEALKSEIAFTRLKEIQLLRDIAAIALADYLQAVRRMEES